MNQADLDDAWYYLFGWMCAAGLAGRSAKYGTPGLN